MFEVLVSMVVGAAGSMMASAMGVGASLIFVPALLVVLPGVGVGPLDVAPVAVATSLAASSVVYTASCWAHWRAGTLRGLYPGCPPIMMAAALGGALGGALVTRGSPHWAMASIALAQVLAACFMLKRIVVTSAGPARPIAAPVSSVGPDKAGGVLTQRCTHAYVAIVGLLTSLGAGGVFLVPYFVWRGIQRQQAAALASLLGIAIAPSATLLFVSSGAAAGGGLGHVHVSIAASMAIGALAGAKCGVRIARTVRPVAWTAALAGLLLMSGARALASALS